MVRPLALVAILSSLFIHSMALAAVPKGAVKLRAESVFKTSGYHCGKVKNSWVAGRMVGKGYFYSLSAEKANVTAQAKGARGRTKAGLQAKARQLALLMKERNPICALGPNYRTPTPTGTPTLTAVPTLTPEPTLTAVPTFTATSSPTPTVLQALRFDLTGSAGLALDEMPLPAHYATGMAASAPGSNLKKVKENGEMEPSVTSGTASVSRFLIAPNDKIYVLFSQKTNLEDTSTAGTCLLAEIDKQTGEPTCIEEETATVQWLDGNPSGSIQFDATGAIYYLARKNDGKTVLRKHKGGTLSDLINDNISVADFLVVSDGSVIIYGTTASSGMRWLRKITPAGGLVSLKNFQMSCNTMLNFIQLFPDNKIYFGLDDCSPGGIYRMEPTAVSLEPNPWMGYSKTWVGGVETDLPAPVAFDCYSYTDPALFGVLPQGCGAYVRQSFRTPDGKMFFIGGSGGKLFKYYPTVSKPATTVANVVVVQGILGNLILAGLDGQGRNIMTLFNTTDSSEIALIPPSQEIEIYHLNYRSQSNAVMFDGLRFSDNKYVIGQVDLNTMQVTASQTGSEKLSDFQTF